MKAKQLKAAELSCLYLQILINLLASICPNLGNEGMAKKKQIYKEFVKRPQIPLLTTLKLDFTLKKKIHPRTTN